MSEPIKPGDLVAVVRWPCCGKGPIGLIYTVARFAYGDQANCKYCGTRHHAVFAASSTVAHHHHVTPIAWLQKINPPTLPQHVERREELPA